MKMIKIVAGNNHFLALDSEGGLFSWGRKLIIIGELFSMSKVKML